MSSPSAGGRVPEDDVDRSSDGAGGLPRALALTLASALVWGVAHLVAGRRVAGGLLLGLWVVAVAALAVTVTVYRSSLVHLAVRPDPQDVAPRTRGADELDSRDPVRRRRCHRRNRGRRNRRRRNRRR